MSVKVHAARTQHFIHDREHNCQKKSMLVMQLFLGQYNSLCPVCSIFLKERKQYLFTSFGETGTHIYDTYTHTHTCTC